MKKKVVIIRLSPNEEERLHREEYERRRKLRIQQVREQHNHFALKVRRAFQQRRQQELEKLGKELKDQWERERNAKISTLQKLYQESLQLLGQGQRSAKENEPDWAAISQKEEENHSKAEERFQEALKELKSQKLQENEKQSRSINARKKALKAEKERSARVASLPMPPPKPSQNIDIKKPNRMQISDVNAYATTYYHLAGRLVDREVDQIKPNAHEEAEVQLERMQQLEMERMRKREEQLEKALLRGKQALKREHLEQDCERLLVELEHMKQTDQLRRRQQVANKPPQIFQPPYKRAEMKEDIQRQMEFAFEDMYTEERRIKGDLVVPLVPEPLPDLPTGSEDHELDVTLDEVAPPLSENTEPDSEKGAGTSQQESPTQVEQTRSSKLKKFLDRVRSQRNQWTEREAVVDLPTVRTDEIPEKDTTIDTGSLSREEMSSELPVEVHKSPHNGPETSEHPTAADTRLPGERSRRHEDRKKRDEELEREKLEQLALLQELEREKGRLEQLLKSQQEDKQLHITHEENQPESVISEREVSSAETTDFTLLPDEDDHARQIGEYQHQLLERHRIHQTYVEAARKRLEEYQRTLQMHYQMAAETVLPPPQPPPLHTRSSQAAAGLSYLTSSASQARSPNKTQTSSMIPTRERVPMQEPRPPDTRLLPEVESSLSNTRYQTRDGSVVMEHLRDRVKPVLVTSQPQTQLPSHLINIPDPIQTKTPVQTGVLPQDSVQMSVGPTKDPNLRQMEEQQTVVLQHRQQRQRHAREVEHMRQQKQYLQTLIHMDAQAEASPTEDVAQNVGQVRRSLLASLLKVIEQRNGGTLSHLEDSQADNGEAPVQSGVSPQGSMLDESQSPTGEMGQMLEQREPGLLSPEEEDQGWETDVEVRRRREETSQLVPEPVPEQLVSGDIGQIRRRVFASLLKAIAETNEGASSEAAKKEDKIAFDSAISQSASAGPAPASIQPRGLRFPPQATRPPVTRVKSAVWETSQQHELSAVPEAETPVNGSLVTGLENSLRLLSRGVDPDPLEGSDWPRLKPRGQQMNSETSSESSARPVWTERLLSSHLSSPQCYAADSKMASPLSSDSGRGADYSGPAATTYRSPTEATLSPVCPESDSLSTTTISTGSYVTTDPERNSDKSPNLIRVGRGPELLAVFSPPSQSIRVEDNAAAGSPRLAVERLFRDSGIQRIIDKHTKELNFSLYSPGRPTDGGGLARQALGASATDQSAPNLERSEGSPLWGSVPSDNAAARRSSLQWVGAASPVQDQDSFRPLLRQPADQRDSTTEHVVGRPSAHSSVIGQLPGLRSSPSLDHSRWDSTLTRMISQFAHRTGGQRLSDPPSAQWSSEHLTTWFEGGPEESPMRPLVEELDESAGQHDESSGERTLVATPSVLDSTPHPQAQPVPLATGPERTQVWDSFHPLMAEVTHNETADPSVNFDQPEHSSPDEQPSSWDPPASFSDNDLSESERSLDLFRARDAGTSGTAPPAWRDSSSLLITSQDHAHKSVLEGAVVSRAEEAVSGGSAEAGILEQSQITLVSLTDTSLLTDEAASLAEEHPDVVKGSTDVFIVLFLSFF